MVKATITGNLVADPELKTGNYTIATCRVAAGTNTKDKDGEFVTNLYSVSYFGNRGENFAKKAHKGDRVVATGTLTASAAISQKSGEAICFLSLNADAIEVMPKTSNNSSEDLDDEL